VTNTVGEGMIVCQNLTKQFGDLVAVDNINLNVGAGELFGFLGPNGAGKTTTIKMLIGLLRPTSGVCRIGGFDVHEQPLEARRVLGYIPDNPFLYEKLTGREFLHFMADLYSIGLTGREQRIDDLLQLLDLQDKGNDLVGGYSRGMRQKIALAGALIHSPRVIFLDEPTVGLDPRGARTMRDILREMCSRGTTVFISTHILEIAERLCDRVAIINKGRMIALGTMDDLRNMAEAGRREEGTGTQEEAAFTEPVSLEEIFLRLTGSVEDADPSRYLG
jgi:ABC-2 type transport system ATP-binding protein